MAKNLKDVIMVIGRANVDSFEQFSNQTLPKAIEGMKRYVYHGSLHCYMLEVRLRSGAI